MRGAREHNLKDVTVAFPRDRLVVLNIPQIAPALVGTRPTPSAPARPKKGPE